MADGPIIHYARRCEHRGRPVAAVFFGIVAVCVGMSGAAGVAIVVIGTVGGLLYGESFQASAVFGLVAGAFIGLVALSVAIICWRKARRCLDP